jgi:hypothetical protein
MLARDMCKCSKRQEELTCVRAVTALTLQHTVSAGYVCMRNEKEITYIDRSQNGTIPTRESNIVCFLETIAHATIADAMLTSVKFLQQPEVAWNCFHRR